MPVLPKSNNALDMMYTETGAQCHERHEAKCRFFERLADPPPPKNTLGTQGSDLLAHLGHELRTLVGVLMGMTELVLEEDLTPSVRDCLQTVEGTAPRHVGAAGQAAGFLAAPVGLHRAGTGTIRCAASGPRGVAGVWHASH